MTHRSRSWASGITECWQGPRCVSTFALCLSSSFYLTCFVSPPPPRSQPQIHSPPVSASLVLEFEDSATTPGSLVTFLLPPLHSNSPSSCFSRDTCSQITSHNKMLILDVHKSCFDLSLPLLCRPSLSLTFEATCKGRQRRSVWFPLSPYE